MATEGIKHGLHLHPDKTKILQNGHNRRRPPAKVTINGMNIDILRTTDSTKYLGRKLTFANPHQVEIESRIAAGWRKFYALKQELTSSCYSLNDRLRLFQGVVTPTVLYGSASWTMTVDLENHLRRSHRQMLRMILKSPRRRAQQPPQDEHAKTDSESLDNEDAPPEETLEPWVEWVKRCTHNVEARLAALQLEDWVSIQRGRKWQWAYKIANDSSKWSGKAALWNPGCDPKCNAYRKPGRQKKRWSDDIAEHIKRRSPNHSFITETSTHWLHIARDKQTWQNLEAAFVTNTKPTAPTAPILAGLDL